jgi:Family of unknown function (DUF6428)
MKLSELKQKLAQHPELNLRFLLPDGARVPAHAHVTEVARVEKRFVDCGGTLRSDVLCRLQIWVAEDLHHRLIAGKLLGILSKAAPILCSDELEVDIEHEAGWISQFPVESVEAVGAELVFKLVARHTACLAEDQCVRPPQGLAAFNPQAIHFQPAKPASTSK